MKNKFLNINIWSSVFLILLMTIGICLTSCEDDDDAVDAPMTITKVYLEDASSSVSDREVSFARLEQLIRIEGSGFIGLKEVYINGFSSYFNPVYVSEGSMLVKIDGDTPVTAAEADVRNTIRFVKGAREVTHSFEIRAAAPTITNISNTFPLSGTTITVYGTGLQEVSRVVFPGDVEVTSGIVSDEDGEFFTVAVPENVSEDGGSLFIECANGGAYSPAYFNFKKGIILDFDGNGQQGYWGWSETGSMINADDLASASIGTGNVSQGTYVPHRPVRIDTFKAASNRCSEVWTAGNDVDDWRGQLTEYIPATTPVNEVAFQFDIYVPEEWSGSGFLKVCLVNGFNGGEWAGNCYNYVPWIVNKEVVPFKTEGWTTVTVPFSEFYAFSDGDFTFEDILTARESASWKNFGFYFENSDINLSKITGSNSDSETVFTSSATTIQVYTDNWRIVSLKTPAYSDFSDE